MQDDHFHRTSKRRGISLSLPHKTADTHTEIKPTMLYSTIQGQFHSEQPIQYHSEIRSHTQSVSCQQPVAAINISTPGVAYYVATKPHVSFTYGQASSTVHHHHSQSPIQNVGESALLDKKIIQLQSQITAKRQFVSRLNYQNCQIPAQRQTQTHQRYGHSADNKIQFNVTNHREPQKTPASCIKPSHYEKNKNNHYMEETAIHNEQTVKSNKHQEIRPPMKSEIEKKVAAQIIRKVQKEKKAEIQTNLVPRPHEERKVEIQMGQEHTHSVHTHVVSKKEEISQNGVSKSAQKKHKSKQRNQDGSKENFNSGRGSIDAAKLRLMEQKLLDIIRVCDYGL